MALLTISLQPGSAASPIEISDDEEELPYTTFAMVEGDFEERKQKGLPVS